MLENENLVTEEVAENVEQTTEETPIVEETQPAEKTYTQAEVDAIVGKAKARAKAKITKEKDREYGDLIETLKAGMGEDEDDVGKITGKLRTFYEDQGIEMPKRASYTARDLEILARAEADEYIRAGFEDVVEEADRLAAIGAANMTDREKAVFEILANHVKKTEESDKLAKIGVPADVYNSAEFQEFAAQFTSNVPITDVYSIYEKTKPRKNYQTIGSMKQSQENGDKDYYSPEDIDRLTEEDLDKPGVWEAVRRSMTGS